MKYLDMKNVDVEKILLFVEQAEKIEEYLRKAKKILSSFASGSSGGVKVALFTGGNALDAVKRLENLEEPLKLSLGLSKKIKRNLGKSIREG